MTASRFVRNVVFSALAAVVSASCHDPTAPPTVEGPSPFVSQVGGEWGGTANLVSVSALLGSNTGCLGGDVLGRILSGVLPTDPVALSVTQDGSKLTARYRSSGTGLSCSYDGTAALTTVSADAAKCDAPALFVRCDTDPTVQLQLVGSTVFGTVSGGTLVGTVTNSYNATGGNSPGSLIVKYSLDVSRR